MILGSVSAHREACYTAVLARKCHPRRKARETAQADFGHIGCSSRVECHTLVVCRVALRRRHQAADDVPCDFFGLLAWSPGAPRWCQRADRQSLVWACRGVLGLTRERLVFELSLFWTTSKQDREAQRKRLHCGSRRKLKADVAQSAGWSAVGRVRSTHKVLRP